jgi:glyoxylase-like metal-dependent hydrolase (beta-lactamase superfamily II)
MILSRRAALGLLATAPVAAPIAANAETFAGRYAYDPQAIGPGLWLVRGADEAIAFGNGGAIANAAILACPEGGAVLFDCGPSLRYAQGLAALAQKLCHGPVRRVFLSHLHPDHALGTAAFDPAIVAACQPPAANWSATAMALPMRCTASWPTGCAAPPSPCPPPPSCPARSRSAAGG